MGGFSPTSQTFDWLANRIVNGSFLVDQIREGGAGYAGIGNGDTQTLDGWSVFQAAAAIADAQVVRSTDLQTDGYFLTLQSPSATGAPGQYMTFYQRIEGTMLDIFQPHIAGIGILDSLQARLDFDAQYESGLAAGVVKRLGVSITNENEGSVYVSTVDIRDDQMMPCAVIFPMTGVTTPINTHSRSAQLRVDFFVTSANSIQAPPSQKNSWALITGAPPGDNIVAHDAEVFFPSSALFCQVLLRNVRLTIGGPSQIIPARSFAEELWLCRRYYQKSFSEGTQVGQGIAIDGAAAYSVAKAGAGAWALGIPLEPPMRAVPVFTGYNPVNANGNWYDSTGAADSGAFSADAASSEKLLIAVNAQAAGDAAGNIVRAHWTANARLS